jgi:hypothetical protein
VRVRGEESVPASPCFSSIEVKGRSECATYEAIPLWLAEFFKTIFV